MAKTERLEEVSFIDLLHYLGCARATGGLLIQGTESIGNVNLHLGEVVYVGVEGLSLRLGERLVEEGHISQDRLAEALRTQQRTKPWKPLGVLCVDAGFVTKKTLSTTLKSQMSEMLSSLGGWQEGRFKFEPGKVAVSDPISLSGYEFWQMVADKMPFAVDALKVESEGAPPKEWQQAAQQYLEAHAKVYFSREASEDWLLINLLEPLVMHLRAGETALGLGELLERWRQRTVGTKGKQLTLQLPDGIQIVLMGDAGGVGEKTLDEVYLGEPTGHWRLLASGEADGATVAGLSWELQQLNIALRRGGLQRA